MANNENGQTEIAADKHINLVIKMFKIVKKTFTRQ